MIYNIAINQFKAVELGLNLVEAFVLHGIITLCGRSGVEYLDKDGTRFYWLSKNLLTQQLPLLGVKADTMYRTMKELRVKGMLEMLESKNITEYYRVTTLGESLVMVGNFSEGSDKVGAKNGQNEQKSLKNASEGSEKNPTIIVYTSNIETPPKFENLAVAVSDASKNKKSSKGSFVLEQYKPNCTTEIWEQVVKPALTYRLQLLAESTTAKERNGYKVSDRVAMQYEKVASQLVEKHGLAKVANYIQNSIFNNVKWISLLCTLPYVEEHLLSYAKSMQEIVSNVMFEDASIRDNNGIVTTFTADKVKELYEKLTKLCTTNLPKAAPLSVAQFKTYLFGDIAKRAIHKLASFASYTNAIKRTIEAKKQKSSGFYNGTIAALIDELIENEYK